MSNSATYAERDRQFHFHAYTNARQHETCGPMIIERGEGIYVWDQSGKRYIEAMSGLWSVAVGFGERRLVEAATRQMEKLPFYHNFTHRSHGPVIDLAEKLISLAPVPMSKAFFTNSGSEANDSLMKMIWYRSNALGLPQKKKLIARERAYHGVTIGSGSLTGLPNNHRSFDLPIERVLRTGSPHYWRDALPGETEEYFSARRARELEELILAEGPETIAAFFGEPVLGAGGIVPPPAGYWQKIQAVLDRYDILLVVDEVVCGFGRTGRMFGCETYGIRPDAMVLSKALSSSYLPISAILLNERFYAPIADETAQVGTFGHGFTGGGHPVAAAVALESIQVIEDKGLVANAAVMGERLRTGLARLANHELVGEVRGVGLLAAVELLPERLGLGDRLAPGQFGAMINAEMQKRGVIIRIMGDTVGFCPPLIIEAPAIDEIIECFATSLDIVTAQIKNV